MRLRCCLVLLCVCGLATAGSADDFPKAFKNAFPPSPFGTPKPDPGSDLFKPGADLFKGGFGANGFQLLPQISMGGLSAGGQLDACAIPLLEAPVAKDREFYIGKLPVGQTPKADAMVTPALPVCGH